MFQPRRRDAGAAVEQRLFDAKITARQDLEAAVAAKRTAEAELQRAEAAVSAAGVTGGGRYLAVRSPIGGRITEVEDDRVARVLGELGRAVEAKARAARSAQADRGE